MEILLKNVQNLENVKRTSTSAARLFCSLCSPQPWFPLENRCVLKNVQNTKILFFERL